MVGVEVEVAVGEALDNENGPGLAIEAVDAEAGVVVEEEEAGKAEGDFPK